MSEERRSLPVPWTPARRGDSKMLAAADLAIGLGIGAVEFGRSLARRGEPLLGPAAAPVAGIVRSAVSITERTGLRARAREAAERGRRERVALTTAVTKAVLSLVPEVTTVVLDQLDVATLVAEHVDLNAIVSDVDIERMLDQIDVNEIANEIVSRIDIDEIVQRIDVAAITRYVIEEVDLPEIIRASTGSITTDTVRGMRMQSIAADERLGRIVDKALLRRRPRQTVAPGADGNAGSDGERHEPRA